MSTAAWLRNNRPHASGDTKPCERCGTLLHRTCRQGPKDWRNRKYCSKACAARATIAQPADERDTRTAELGQLVREHGRCRGSSANFIPDAKADALDALVICRSGCPVLQQCLEYGRATRAFGVWGGEWLNPRKQPKTA